MVLLHDRATTEEGVNRPKKTAVQQERQSDCCSASYSTLAALIEHKRAAYQAGHCWGQMMTPAPKLPSRNDWGWKKKASGKWDVIWTTLPEASEACWELLRSGCKIDCKRGRCKCHKVSLECTALCQCGGHCSE